MAPTRTRASLLALLLLAAGCGSGDKPSPASASSEATAQPGADGDAEAHPHEELGTVTFPVSCGPEAQAEFNHATALLHSFSFAPAIKGFKRVVELDGTCAMGHWGEAMSLLGNPFAWPPGTPALVDGHSAVGRAVAVGATTPRERSYIDAIGSFYRDAETVDHRVRSVAYTEAMGRLVEQHPDDTEAKMFYALALAATALPTDKTYANQQRAAGILEGLAAAQPDHPGVAHYLIHSYDYPASADKGREAARRYAKIAPSVSHALHMPSHIFTRLGDWDESIRSNAAAAKSAREELTAGHQQGFGSYNALHALDYLMYAHLQQGQDRAAQGVLDEITAINNLGVENLSAAYAFAVIPARDALERGLWGAAAKLTLRPPSLDWKRFPQAEAASAFARGLGAARSGDTAAARVEIARIETIKTALTAAKQAYWAGQADIQIAAVAAWAALADGRREEALRLMRSAAEQEAATEKHPVMPGPLVPARELLGEMLIEVGQSVDALAEFEASHRVEPGRFRGLYGAARAAEMAGDKAKARGYYERLVALTRNGDGQRREVAAARTYLSEAK